MIEKRICPNCTSKGCQQLTKNFSVKGNGNMNERQQQLLQFAVSFLISNLDSAYADDEGMENMKPSEDELEDLLDEVSSMSGNF